MGTPCGKAKSPYCRIRSAPGPPDQNPFSWFSHQIPVAGNIEISLQARLDAVVEEPDFLETRTSV